MRVMFVTGSNIIITNVETVDYDEQNGVLDFYENGSEEPDYTIECNKYDAKNFISKLLANGYVDIIGYGFVYNIFDEDESVQ